MDTTIKLKISSSVLGISFLLLAISYFFVIQNIFCHGEGCMGILFFGTFPLLFISVISLLTTIFYLSKTKDVPVLKSIIYLAIALFVLIFVFVLI